MRDEVLMAGSGGQGVNLMGEVLARAALLEGKHVTWYPSYSPEVRGGTSNCTIVIADEPVGSPVRGHPRVGVMLDQRALDTRGPDVRPAGILVVNSSLASRLPERDDLEIHELPGNDIASDLGDERATNMVLLGAYVTLAEPVAFESITAALELTLPERHKRFIPLNVEALKAGAGHVRESGGALR